MDCDFVRNLTISCQSHYGDRDRTVMEPHPWGRVGEEIRELKGR